MRAATVGRAAPRGAGPAARAPAPRRRAPPTRRRAAAPAVRCAAPPPSLRALAAACWYRLDSLSSFIEYCKSFRRLYRAAPAAAKVAFRTAAYITALGAALLAAPLTCLGAAFGAGATLPSAGWARVGGVLAALFGFYYAGAALDDSAGRRPLAFYAATVWGRAFLSAAFAAIAATDAALRPLVLLAVVNAAGAWALARAVGADARR
jgi:hypothetical protein